MKFRAGFTLIELIIFTAIFSLAMGAFLGVFTSVSGVAVRQSSTAEVQSQSQFLLQTIQYYVERSSMVSATVDAATDTLILRMPAESEDPTVISADGSAVSLKIGSGEAQTITSDKVEVSDLSFIRRSNPGGKNSVAVSFTVTYASGGADRRFSHSIQTAVARVSAAKFDSDIVPGLGNNHALGISAAAWRSINDTIFFSGSNVGVGAAPFGPAAPLHVQGDLRVAGGDLNINSFGKSVILRSPDGSCWQLAVNNISGAVSADGITCP